jgi:UDP-glucose 4-epimerase
MDHKYYENNVAKMNVLLQAAVDSKIEHFIFSSSAAIFGTSELTSEDSEKNPSNPYVFSKLMGEQLLESYSWSLHKVGVILIDPVFLQIVVS